MSRPSNRFARIPWIPVALGALALILRLWGLTRQSLWIDEMFSLKYAGLDTPLNWEGIRLNLQGPLHAVFLNGWCGLFGWGELAVRLPQAIASAVTAPLLYLVARPVFGQGRAIAGAALLAVNPFHIWYAQEVRNYTFAILCSVIAIGMIQRLDLHGRWRDAAGLAGSWIAGLLFNLSFAFHIAAAGIWGIARFRRRRRTLLCLGAAAASTLIALLPWEVEFFHRRIQPSHLLTLESVPQEERLRGEATAPAVGIPYLAYTFSVGFSLGPSLRELRVDRSAGTLHRHALPIAATGLVFGILGTAGLVGWIRGAGDRRRLWLLALIVPITAAFLVATRNVKVFNPRYAAVALPAFAMLLADGAALLGPRRWGGALVAGVLILSSVSIAQLQTQPRYWKEDARSATRVLRSEVGAGDLIFVVGTWDPIYRYYWQGLREDRSIDRFFIPHRTPPGEGAEAEEGLAAIARARETYVLFYRDDFHDPMGAWEGFLSERFDVDRRWEFPGVRIWRLGARRSG